MGSDPLGGMGVATDGGLFPACHFSIKFETSEEVKSMNTLIMIHEEHKKEKFLDEGWKNDPTSAMMQRWYQFVLLSFRLAVCMKMWEPRLEHSNLPMSSESSS